MSVWRRHRRKLVALAFALAVAPCAHAVVMLSTGIDPPRVDVPALDTSRAWTRVRGGVRLAQLEGTPEQIGASTARLLRDPMIADEGEMWADFERHVPWWAARVAIQDWARVRYRHVDQAFGDERRRELAAEARAFDPDPFASRMPTYQRMVFLHALYDITLPLEHSPLIGCTTFALGPAATRDGHVLAARTFDFEGGDAFDRDKVVYLVHEQGAVPYASVAWPGFVGVVTGMNAEGVLMVVHGARARSPAVDGIPVAASLRAVLAHANDTPGAVGLLSAQRVMVSHIVFVADAAGRFAVVERAPGVEAYVRTPVASEPDRIAVTNHFEGPLAGDAADARVRQETSTLARRARIDALLSAVGQHEGTPEGMLAMLRDHTCAGDAGCPLGDRRAIDAQIATHGVVADLTDRLLWVSVGPHLSGRFVRLDLRELLALDHDPDRDGEPETMPADPSTLAAGGQRR